MAAPDRERSVLSERPFTGKLLKIRVDHVILPNGRHSKREIVEHRGAVAIVPITEEGVILERQYRHAVGKTIWEIPAGTLEEGESSLDAAARELEEETGYFPGKLEELAHFYVAVGYSTEIIRLYMATDLTRKPSRQEADESIESLVVPLSEALRMVESNEIEDAKTIIGLLLAKDRLGGR